MRVGGREDLVSELGSQLAIRPINGSSLIKNPVTYMLASATGPVDTGRAVSQHEFGSIRLTA